ncbi:unnamed protein product [Closterium sp. NIES-53]
MEVARTSMIHAAVPQFLWLFAVMYAAHQVNLWPRVSLPETSPILRWTGKVGDASVFQVWGSRAFVRDTSADKLSAHAIPYVFLGFPPDASGWQFYNPTSRRVLSSQDVTFDKSVPFYRLIPYHSAPLPPLPLLLAPGPPPVLLEGASGVAASGGAASGGAEPAGAEPGEPGGAESEGAESGGAGPRGTVSAGGPAGASPRLSSRRQPLSPQQLLEWFAQCKRLRSGTAGAGGSAAGGTGAGGTGATRLGGAGVTIGAGGVGGAGAGGVGAGGGTGGGGAGGGTGGGGAAGPGGARTRGTGAAGAGGVGGTGARDPGAGDLGAGCTSARARGAGVGDPSAGGARAGGARAGGTGAGDPGGGGAGAWGAEASGPGAGGTLQWRPFFVPPPPSSLPPPDSPASLPASLVCAVRTGHRVPRPHPPPVLGTHAMALCPSFVPLRLPLPSPPASSLHDVPDPESDLARAASPTVPCLLATVVTDPLFESTAASALVAELVDFAAACHLDYATSIFAESESDCPLSVEGECALSTHVLEDKQKDFECLTIAVPHLAAMLLAPEGDPDAPDIPTPRSYAEAITVPPCGANIVDGMWIFRVKRPPGSSPVFKARYAARGFSQRQGVDFFHTFSPSPKMTTLRGSLHEEIWRRRPPGFIESFPADTQWSLRRPVYGLRQAPREWHYTLRTTLAALWFAPSSPDRSPFLSTDTSLPPFYVLVYVNDLVFATADTEALALVKSKLQKRHTCTDLGELRSYLGLQITRDRARRTITLTQSHMVHQVLQRFDFWYSSPLSTPLPTGPSLSAPPTDESVEPSGPILARYVAPGRHRPEHWEAAKRVLRYLCSTSGMGLVLGGRSPVVLTGHADASWVDDLATQRLYLGYTFSLGSGSVSWCSTRSSSIPSSNSEAEICAGAMATQELRWLTYLLTDLGERPRSSPVLYVDNKAMIAFWQEHRTKHIALRYFLARKLQQRGHLRLTYVATRPTLLIYSPRHFSLVIISVSVLF